MSRIRALNDDESSQDSSSEDVGSCRKQTREAQEGAAVELYTLSLSLISSSKIKEAAQTLENVLLLPYLNENDNKKCSPLQSQIKLGCLKNLSTIYYSLAPDHEAAARVLKEIVLLDSTNISVWYRLGIMCKEILDYELAVYSFAQGLKCSPNHWGCLEGLVTLLYVLDDPENCLKYCALGLSKDPGFLRGLVYRDHIFQRQPYLKDQLKNKFPHWDELLVSKTYDEKWKDKFLDEARNLFKLERDHNSLIISQEREKNSQVVICPYKISNYTFTELCKVVIAFHSELKAKGSYLLPICFSDEIQSVELVSVEAIIENTHEAAAEEDMNDLKTDPTVDSATDSRRPSTDEKETQSSTTESGLETTDTTSNFGTDEKSRDGFRNERLGKDSTPFSPGRNNKKKNRRDVKWWQIEGKRRSQRVRGILSAPSQDPDSKSEMTFGDRLKKFFPPSILSEVIENGTEANGKNPSSHNNSVKNVELHYFSSEKETEDVKEFLRSHQKTLILDVIEDLAKTLIEKTNYEWPGELIQEFGKLYRLYRLHTEWPTPISETPEIVQLNSLLSLTLLEFQLDQTQGSNIESLKCDPNFLSELFQVSQISKTHNDSNFRIRFNWFLSKYFLKLAKVGKLDYDNALYYLSEVKLCMSIKEEEISDKLILHLPTSNDNLISMEIVEKKLQQLEKLENIDKIHELYETKNYDELLDILDFCIKKSSNEDIEPCDQMNRYYYADAHFHKENYTDCLQQCLNIINRKHSIGDGVLPKVLLLMKKTVLNFESNEVPTQLTRQIMKSLISLIISYEYKLCINPTIAVSPWIILHCLLVKMEKLDPATWLSPDESPNSILLLQFAHEILGRMRKCGINKGRLLTFTINSLLPLMSSDVYSEYEELNHCIEQAIYCAYHHPTKISKLRHLSDHGCSGIELDWTKSVQVYQYFKPNVLPEFDSYDSISVDDEGLFQRILAVMPEEIKPTTQFQQLQNYLNGNIDKIPEFNVTDFPLAYTDIFYLIADHHFKTKEWHKAIEYYSWDLTLHEYRFDSWAAMGLGIGGMINNLLTSCENFKIIEILSNAKTAVRCFENALRIQPDNSKLHIEYGSFVYSMHSLCSRLLKQGTDKLSMEEFNLVETKKNEYIKIVAQCFEPTDLKEVINNTDEEQQEEIWIHHYMWGKILEKLHPGQPTKYLEQYELASKILDEQGALYPARINFYSPQELSIEALEIYYRIHASVLGYIENHEYSSTMEQTLLNFLNRAAESPFMQAKYKRLENAAENKRKKSADRDMAEVRIVLENILDKVDEEMKNIVLGGIGSRRSSSNSSSTSSSSEDSTSSSSDESKKQPQSFSLSMFQQKIKEKELRDKQLAEEQKKIQVQSDHNTSSVSKEKIEMETSGDFEGVKFGKLIWKCVNAMEECISRFPTHHKSYFKISNAYLHFSKENIKISRAWLLGSEIGEKKKIPGLFSDRKPTNFFNGVWRNPVQDIDRPGSFPYHMSKTIQNLIDVLNTLNDHEMLTELGIQLAKIPEPDKKYLYDFEREQFSQEAFKNCVASAKRLLLLPSTSSSDDIQTIGREIFGSLVKLRKVDLPEYQQSMNLILLDAFKILIKSMGGDDSGANTNQAFKHFQQIAWESKVISSGKNSASSGGNTAITNSAKLTRRSELQRRMIESNSRYRNDVSSSSSALTNTTGTPTPTTNPQAQSLLENHNLPRTHAIKLNSHSRHGHTAANKKPLPSLARPDGTRCKLGTGTSSSTSGSGIPDFEQLTRNLMNASPSMSTSDLLMKIYGSSILSPNLFNPQMLQNMQQNQSGGGGGGLQKIKQKIHTQASDKRNATTGSLISNAQFKDHKPSISTSTSKGGEQNMQSRTIQKSVNEILTTYNTASPVRNKSHPSNQPRSSHSHSIKMNSSLFKITKPIPKLSSVNVNTVPNNKQQPLQNPKILSSINSSSSSLAGGTVKKRLQQQRSQESPGSTSVLRTPSGSIPMSSVSTLNTSPYKAQSTLVLRPGLEVGFNPVDLQITRVERPTTPPAAHSSNRSSYKNNGAKESPEIIDLTTSKSPINAEKIVRQIMHPENSSVRKTAKRPSTDVIPIYSPSSGPMVEHQNKKQCRLPPKKQQNMRPAVSPEEITTISLNNRPLNPTTTDANPTSSPSLEVITID